MTRQIVISDALEANQRRAADPSASVWVTANAGSGKTHVLTQRVLRLLLLGVAPESVLCLTYTKAAAAEMRRRLSEWLGRWAVLGEAELGAELTRLEDGPVAQAVLHRARTLFAHALETPGGLKIVTIHAFCESVLHRFPLEAAVPFDFAVLEEHERAEIVLRARETVLSGGLRGDSRVALAVESLFELLSDGQLNEAIATALGQARKLRPVLADRDGAKARLRTLTGYDPRQDRAAIVDEIETGHPFGADDHRDILSICPPKLSGTQFEDKLARYAGRLMDAEAILDIFLTKDQTAPKGFPKKALVNAAPELAIRLAAEANRLAGLCLLLRRAELIERSEALLDVLGAISDFYEGEKRARSLLDFDDLIARTVALLGDRTLGPWVQYKLDAGIAHILVDESQDTNPEQWQAVTALADEFFAGQSAVERPRTIFAVGDVKQSIYSFQGAEPVLFIDTGAHYHIKAQQVTAEFRRVPLHTSFRTLPGILRAVDLVFASEAMHRAVLETDIIHDTARAEPGGTVTLWPPVQDQGEDGDPENWPLEAPKRYQSAARQVAERIAVEIARWVADKRPLGPRGRPVRFGDVLILVQARAALFRELIRALHRQRIPTPGADRLEVTTHIAVLDLLALGDVLLNPGDDLQLAALLRSPLYDLREDELFAIAQPRPQGSRLWDGLAACTLPDARSAYAELASFRSRLDFERPFEFFAAVLYAAGGLKRFHKRFGREVDDLFAEFLDLALAHEQGRQPSLQGFLASMRAREVEIKRELNEGGGGVRVMTVHGAKGLEAPIVILADAASKPMGSQLRNAVHIVTAPPGPLLVHASSSAAHVEETDGHRQAYEQRQKEEYWRKLYVGMTRAEDELYVTGTLTAAREAARQLEDTWYQAIETALGPDAEPVLDGDGKVTALVFPRERPAPEPLRDVQAAAATAAAPVTLPPLPVHPRIETVRPSSAFSPADAEHALDPLSARSLDPDTARQRGSAVHLLLQHLPKVPVPDWHATSARALAQRFPRLFGMHEEIAGKAIGILSTPELAHVFGPDSRAEVPFLAMADRRGTRVRLAGRIDRLVVTPTRVLVVDFKSDATEPLSPAAVKDAYLTQLGLYALVARELFPGRAIEAGILWTAPESLMILPAAPLMAAVDGFTMA